MLNLDMSAMLDNTRTEENLQSAQRAHETYLLSKERIPVHYTGRKMAESVMCVAKYQYPKLWEEFQANHKPEDGRKVYLAGETIIDELAQIFLNHNMVFEFDRYFYNNEFTQKVNDKAVQEAWKDEKFVKAYRDWRDATPQERKNMTCPKIEADIEGAAAQKNYLFCAFDA